MSFPNSISSLALPVFDMQRSVRFYERLGLRRSSQAGRDGEVFFALDNLVLTLVPRLVQDASADDGAARVMGQPGGVGPVQYYETAQRLDAALAAARIAGAAGAVGARSAFQIFKTAWFDDPDGHQWELKFDSALTLVNGLMRLPE